jgi:hypothetical protein
VKKTRFDQLRDAREDKESRLRARRLPLVLVLVAIVLVTIAYCASGAIRQGDISEQKQCDDYCMTNYNLKGVLVPIVTNQRTRPGASQGPYKCTCPR